METGRYSLRKYVAVLRIYIHAYINFPQTNQTKQRQPPSKKKNKKTKSQNRTAKKPPYQATTTKKPPTQHVL